MSATRHDVKAPAHCCSVHRDQWQQTRVLELARQGAAPHEIGYVIGIPTRDVLRMLGLAPRAPFTRGTEA